MKKTLSVILSVLLLVSLFSLGVNAAESDAMAQEETATAEDNTAIDKETDANNSSVSDEKEKTKTNVKEEEKDSILSLKSAVIEEIDGVQCLKIQAKNNTSLPLSYVQCLIIESEGISNGELVFKEFSNSYGYFATSNEVAPYGETSFLFELDACENEKAILNIGFIFNQKSDSVYSGSNLNEKNSQSVIYYDILNQDDDEFSIGSSIKAFLEQTGFFKIAENWKENASWKVLVMFVIAFVLMYLAIVKKFEPLLLLPIAFGMLLTNLPGAEMYHPELFAGGHVHWDMFPGIGAGLLDYLYLGIKLGIYPCLIFLGIGAMTDFAPLIANPKSLLLGGASQLGIFVTYICAAALPFFSPEQAASIGIIGGADGPTAIFVSSKLAPELLGPIAVAAYSYMALVPFIQPPIMRALTTKKERQIVMKELRPVSKKEKIIFPIAVTALVALLVPSATPLVGCLMLGNLMRESGVVDRIAKAAQNELMNIVTIFLGISVGATATAEAFLDIKTLAILAMGIVAFSFGSAGGILLAKFMNLFLKNKINPLIGSAGVSAVPMAARVSQTEGQKANPSNFLLMHAMGPNVAGVIGSAIAAGVLIALFA